jgi:predicted thioesterase
MQHYAASLVGKTVKRVRSLDQVEMKEMYWHETSDPTAVIEFTDGTYAIVMADPEGNGTGFLEIGSY